MFWVVFKIYLLLIVFVIYAISFVFRLRQRKSVPAMDHRMQACFLTMTRQAKFAGEEHDTQTQDQRGKDLRHAKRLRELMNSATLNQLFGTCGPMKNAKTSKSRPFSRVFCSELRKKPDIYMWVSIFRRNEMAPKDITGKKSAPCSDPRGRSEPPKAEAKKSLPCKCLELLLRKEIPACTPAKTD